MPLKPARLQWSDDGSLESLDYGDVYFQRQGGMDESDYVFLQGNRLKDRFLALPPNSSFHIAELGFGTGLNLLATRIAAGDIPIRYTSFEAFPMAAADIARALQAFPEAGAVAGDFLAHWATGARQFQLGAILVEVIIGDARTTLPAWQGRADAWYLDGFSPAKNPELWNAALMDQVARHTAPGGTFATYTAAGFVRRGLQAAGFAVERRKGHGHKRHMATGEMPAKMSEKMSENLSE